MVFQLPKCLCGGLLCGTNFRPLWSLVHVTLIARALGHLASGNVGLLEILTLQRTDSAKLGRHLLRTRIDHFSIVGENRCHLIPSQVRKHRREIREYRVQHIAPALARDDVRPCEFPHVGFVERFGGVDVLDHRFRRRGGGASGRNRLGGFNVERAGVAEKVLCVLGYPVTELGNEA